MQLRISLIRCFSAGQVKNTHFDEALGNLYTYKRPDFTRT